NAVGEGLALLARQELADLLASVENLVGGCLEDVVALLDAGARPRRERRLGRHDRFARIIGAGAGIVSDDVGCIRVMHSGLGVATDPFAGDIVAVQLVEPHVCKSSFRVFAEPATDLQETQGAGRARDTDRPAREAGGRGTGILRTTSVSAKVVA